MKATNMENSHLSGGWGWWGEAGEEQEKQEAGTKSVRCLLHTQCYDVAPYTLISF